MASALKIQTAKDVYEPAEDSLLLAKHTRLLRGRILEIGCGSGIVALECAATAPANEVEAVDINAAAVALAKKNAELNHVKNVKIYKSDLFAAVKNKFDWIVFNPPYLPTTKGDKVNGKLNAALDGGATGRETIARFIEQAPAYLKKNGGLLLLVSSLTGVEEVLQLLNKNGFKADVIEEQSFFFEKLVLIRAKPQRS
ncbi:MAG: HemK2/MTQ2 family protein methyltransferase [Candidatus Micrarchaeota archaeon]